MELKCRNCKKQFKLPPSRAKTAKFCSKECYSVYRKNSEDNCNEHLKKRKKVTCKNCKTVFERQIGRNTKFCCFYCYWQYRRNHPNTKYQSRKNKNNKRITKKCKNCNNKFKVWPYRKNAQFCCSDCHNKYRRETIVCPTCEKLFSAEQNEKRKYCSEKCCNKGLLKRKSRFSESVFNFLKKHYSCEKEVCVKGNKSKIFGDILLSDYNIIIECNGDYWHCNPDIFNENFFHKQIKKKAKEIWNDDKNRSDFLEKKGYKVIIVWENDWSSNRNFFNKLKNNIEYEIYKSQKN